MKQLAQLVGFSTVLFIGVVVTVGLLYASWFFVFSLSFILLLYVIDRLQTNRREKSQYRHPSMRNHLNSIPNPRRGE